MVGGIGARHLERRVLMGGDYMGQMPRPYRILLSPSPLFPFPLHLSHYLLPLFSPKFSPNAAPVAQEVVSPEPVVPGFWRFIDGLECLG